MATNNELEQQVRDLQRQVQDLRQALAEIASQGTYLPAQQAAIRKALRG